MLQAGFSAELLGQVWTVPRPLVYRALDDLGRLGLIEPVRTEPGANNVSRTIVAATAAGQSAVRIWLDRPVAHVREVRSALFVKLAFLERAGRSPRALLEAEHQDVASLVQRFLVDELSRLARSKRDRSYARRQPRT